MILLGTDIGDKDSYGWQWERRLNEWINQKTWDLLGIYEAPDTGLHDSENILPILDAFQELAMVTGATNIQQVEYFFRLELRLKALEEKTEEL